MIIQFVTYFIKQYNSKAPDEDLIDRNKFFRAFSNERSIYNQMKDRFTILNKNEVFHKYLQIPEFENSSNLLQIESANQ